MGEGNEGIAGTGQETSDGEFGPPRTNVSRESRSAEQLTSVALDLREILTEVRREARDTETRLLRRIKDLSKEILDLRDLVSSLLPKSRLGETDSSAENREKSKKKRNTKNRKR